MAHFNKLVFSKLQRYKKK